VRHQERGGNVFLGQGGILMTRTGKETPLGPAEAGKRVQEKRHERGDDLICDVFFVGFSPVNHRTLGGKRLKQKINGRNQLCSFDSSRRSRRALVQMKKEHWERS